MIDTVKIDIPIYLSRRKIGTLEWSKLNESMIKKQVYGQMFDPNDDTLPRITYTLKDGNRFWFKVEVSVPRFLYGNNIKEVTAADIKLFYRKLRRFLAGKLRLSLSKIPPIEDCELEKLHLCNNFNVGDKVKAYLKAMNNIDVSKFKRIPYNASGRRQQESVVWKNGKSVIKVYDKEEELRQKKRGSNKEDHIPEAKGILRFEVELSDSEMRKHSPKRLVKDLLQPTFIRETLELKLKLLGLNKPLKVTTQDMILDKITSSDLDRRTKHSLMTFAVELLRGGEGHCKAEFSKTAYFRTSKKLKALLGTDKIVLNDVDLPILTLKRKKGRLQQSI